MNDKEIQHAQSDIIRPPRDLTAFIERRYTASTRVIYDVLSLITMIWCLLLTLLGKSLIFDWKNPVNSNNEFEPISRTNFFLVGILNYFVCALFLIAIYAMVRKITILTLRDVFRQQLIFFTANTIASLAPTALFMYSEKFDLGTAIFTFWSLAVIFIGMLSIFLIFFVYFPGNYVKSATPFSIGLLIKEYQALRKNLTQHNISPFEKQKNVLRTLKVYRRSRVYVDALLISVLDDNSRNNERAAQITSQYRKMFKDLDYNKAIDVKAIDSFLNWLSQEFSLGFMSLNTNDQKNHDSPVDVFIRNLVNYLDGAYMITAFAELSSLSKLTPIWIKSGFPIKSQYLSMKSLNNRSKAKLIRRHINIASSLEILSAQQKLTSIFIIGILITLLFCIQYLRFLNGQSIKLFSKESLNLALMFLFVEGITAFIVAQIQKKTRKAGIDAAYHQNMYLLNVIVMIFSLTAISLLSTNSAFLRLIENSVNKYSSTVSLVISTGTFVLLTFYLRPPAEQKRTEVASSFLIRELYYLIQNITQKKSLPRRDISRHVYFAKKYLNTIATNLSKQLYKSSQVKQQLAVFFETVKKYLDDLHRQLQLGSQEVRIDSAQYIAALMESVLNEEYGEIPKQIPEIESSFGSLISIKQPGLMRKLVQLIDSSWTARFVLAGVLVLITNFFSPLLWSLVQNISGWLQILGN